MADQMSPEMLKKIAEMVAAGVAEALKQRKEEWADKARKAAPEKQVVQDATISKAFAAKGYKDIVLLDRTRPLAEQLSTVTLLTYQKWFEIGRRVIEGEKALKVRGYHIRLFHKSQTRIATVEERKANLAKMQEAIKRREAEDAAKAAGKAA